MKVHYQFRFYPTKKQECDLSQVFGACRFVYNWALRLRTDSWFKEGRKIGYHESSALLTKLKCEPETKWLQDVSCVPPQQALRHLQSAFQNFWNKTGRYPTFKRKHRRQSAEYTTSAFRWDAQNKNLRCAGLGRLRIRWSREFDSTPTTVTIAKEPSGRYFVTLCLDEKVRKLPKTGLHVGIDLGVSRLATLSNGERVANPRHLGRKLERLAFLQRRLSRRKKGSGRWQMARLDVSRFQERIANSRRDYLNKVTTDLVRRFDVIGVEDLNVVGMVRNRCLARAVSDVGMGMFRQMLAYKCEWYGKTLKVVDRFFPSSKRCSDCGHVVESLPLSVREWDCPQCGAHHDRDENAAKNIDIAEGHSVRARGEGVGRRRTSVLKRSPCRNANRPKLGSHS